MVVHNSGLRLIFFYGKGGAGKDSVAERLVTENPGWAIISTGDRIKQAQNPNDEFHSIIAPYAYYISQGKNLPMKVVMNPQAPEKSIIPSFIASEMEKGTPAIISTGFPRTREQLFALDDYLEKLRQTQQVSDEHFYIIVSNETSLKRTTQIRPAEYQALGKSVRADDNEETARRRLGVFMDDTLPAIDALKKEGRLHVVSGEGTKDETYALVEDVLFPKTALELSGGESSARPIRERR